MTLKFVIVPLFAVATLLWSESLNTAIFGTVRDVRNVETGAEARLGRYQVSAAKEAFHSRLKTGIGSVFGYRVVVDLTLQAGEIEAD